MKKQTVELSDSASHKLDALKKRFGSYRVAVEIAIERLCHQEFPGRNMSLPQNQPTIHLYDAELLGGNIGVIVKDAANQAMAHLPMGMDEAEDRTRDLFPNAQIVRHEQEESVDES